MAPVQLEFLCLSGDVAVVWLREDDAFSFVLTRAHVVGGVVLIFVRACSYHRTCAFFCWEILSDLSLLLPLMLFII